MEFINELIKSKNGQIVRTQEIYGYASMKGINRIELMYHLSKTPQIMPCKSRGKIIGFRWIENA